MKYRVCVYAICKNEQAFVDRWVESMREADEIVVLDTGSTDGTVERLTERGVRVYQETIIPWRFDVARNHSLALVPSDTDICVCTDLDEVFESGWRQRVEEAWDTEIRQLSYRYTWSFQPDGTEGVVFWQNKIHARHGFVWKHPVHEVLQDEAGRPLCRCAIGVQLNHYADLTKSRGQYLPLLELSVQEDPLDDRNLHYLGREYYYYQRYEDCIRTLERHLQLPTAQWRDERCASLRLMGKSHQALGNAADALNCFLRAAAEAPYLREPWLDLSRHYYYIEDWEGVVYGCTRALAICERPATYMTEGEAYGAQPYDLLSLGYFYTGQYRKALAAVEKALRLTPNDSRLQKNRNDMVRRIREEGV